jgi:hypothetical protein
MQFTHGDLVERLRSETYEDPYSGTDVDGDWSSPDVEVIPNAWIAQSSTSRFEDISRTQFLEQVSLYCPPEVDLRKTDRIRVGGEGGTVYEIEGIPHAPRNPFTGWQPVREVPLGREVG